MNSTEPTLQIPIELLEQFERGNVLLFIGEGINRGILPSAAELAQELAGRCDYPSEEPLTLPRVAGYYELTRDRQGLIQFLRDRLERPGVALLRAHELVARLRPSVVVTTCYDRLLERALQEACVPYVPVVCNAEVAYDDRDKVLLVWLWGVLDQPDSIVVTEDDRRLFLEGRANLSDVLRGELARRTWLFVGFDAEDEWFRGFYDSVNRGLDRQSRRAYIFGAAPGAYIRTWWEKHNAEILSAEVETFLAVLTEQLAARDRPELAPRPSALAAAPLPEEPYKALASYEAQDRALFFGRDREIEELTALIHAHRLVLLYGASGVGKTSLLQAGVLPRLEESDPGYAVVSVRALTDPAEAIRTALRRQWSEAVLPANDVPLVDFLTAAIRAAARQLVVVIDQFEEFFIRLSPEFRAAFIAEIGALYEARDLPVKVVLSLREDYLASVNELEYRIPEVFRIRMRLLPLGREQARNAVVSPVEALGYSYEPQLVDRLLNDLFCEGVMPPQLQLVCIALFRRVNAEKRRDITNADYEALGGAQSVLHKYLDEELSHFSAGERAVARQVLEELVTTEGARRVELSAYLSTRLDIDPAVLSAVLAKLVQARLLCAMDYPETGALAYELTHDYLAGILSKSMPADQMTAKTAQEILTRNVATYLAMKQQGKGRWLVDPDTTRFLNSYRTKLGKIGRDEVELLFRSSLAAGGYNAGYWYERALVIGLNVESMLRSAEGLLFAVIRRRLANLSLGDAVIVSASSHYAKKAKTFAGLLDLPFVLFDRRQSINVMASFLVGDVKEQCAILVDDEIVTATTASLAVQALLESGARSVILCCSYCALDEIAARKLGSCGAIDRFITTDAIPLSQTVVEVLQQSFAVDILAVSEMAREIAGNATTEAEFEDWLKMEGLMGFQEKRWLTSIGLQEVTS